MDRERDRANVRRASQALSFCLPGLGHLYAGHPWRGFAVNGAFLLMLSNASTRLFVPFVAVFAAWEAGKLAPTTRANVPGRQGLFSLAGGVGVFLWSVVVFGELSPWRAVQRTRETVERAARECRRGEAYAADCVENYVDGWGRKLVPGEDGRPRSLGKDGRDGTLDDIAHRGTRPGERAGAFDHFETPR